MISSERILKELADEEGVEFKVYLCTAGHRTIGIGHNLDAEPIDKLIGRKLNKNGTITQDELELIVDHDVEKVKNQLDQYLPWWRDLPDFAQYVLISLTFNMGIGTKVSNNPVKYNGLRGFVNTLNRFQVQDWEGAALGLERSKWYSQVKRRGRKITTILRTGKFPDGKSS